MYKRILVPHGGTEAGDEALKHAINISKHESAKIILLHVLEPWPDPSFGIMPEVSKKEQIEIIFANSEENTRKFLAERTAQCRKENIECEGIFRVGKPSESIIKYANENDIDLIVMGKKKKLPNYKSIFKIGSVVKKVQEQVNCSMLLVEIDDED